MAATPSISGISGRTIHSDGTIIPFHRQTIRQAHRKRSGLQGDVKSLYPARRRRRQHHRIPLSKVALRTTNYFIHPDSIGSFRSDLFTRNAHYRQWKPTGEQLITKGEHGEQLTSTVAWTPILPSGAEIKQTHLPVSSANPDGQLVLDLTVHNVPPVPSRGIHACPIGSVSYRVLLLLLGLPHRSKSIGKMKARDGPGPPTNSSAPAARSRPPSTTLRRFPPTPQTRSCAKSTPRS